MHRFRQRTNNMLEVKEPWKDCGWEVALAVNNRQSITAIAATCTKKIGPDITVTGYSRTDVAPFDDLAETIRDQLLNSALAALDEIVTVEPTLWDDPAS